MEKGWTAATLIDDSPLALPVGTGLHPYRNYSRLYYGLVRLRIALGNSLNIPAVRTVQFVGPARFLERLSQLGFQWSLMPGHHIVQAKIWLPGRAKLVESPPVGFTVNP